MTMSHNPTPLCVLWAKDNVQGHVRPVLVSSILLLSQGSKKALARTADIKDVNAADVVKANNKLEDDPSKSKVLLPKKPWTES